MKFIIYYQMIADGYFEINANSENQAMNKVEAMSDKDLYENANDPILVITDEHGFAIRD